MCLSIAVRVGVARGADPNERGTREDDERHQPFLDWYPHDVGERHEGLPALVWAASATSRSRSRPVVQ